MVVRRGITILSDVVMMVALLIIISGLWVYTAELYRQKHTLEAAAASEALHVAGLMEEALSDPGMCTQASISLPRGVRIYVANVNLSNSTGVLVIVKPAGARLDASATRNILVTLGASRGQALLVYENGTLRGAALILNNTLIAGLPAINASLRSGLIDLWGANWTDKANMIYFNYKDTVIRVCSRWDSGRHMVVLALPQP